MADRVGQQPGNYRLDQLIGQGNFADVYLGTHIHLNTQAAMQNLPASPTPLLGREQERMAVCALLRRPEMRLLTLTGVGGIGKTRLGIAVASAVLADFADGVSFISLAPLSDPDLVLATIAQTLGIKENPGVPLSDLLRTSLQDKHLLLLLDNFEQVVRAAPGLSELL